jgi:hypothetical protein
MDDGAVRKDRSTGGRGPKALAMVWLSIRGAIPKLLEIAQTRRPMALLAGPLPRRHQNRHQDRDDGDHDQQFDQGETGSPPNGKSETSTKARNPKSKTRHRARANVWVLRISNFGFVSDFGFRI